MNIGLIKVPFRFKDFWIAPDWRSQGTVTYIEGLKAVLPKWLETPNVEEFPAKPWQHVASFRFTGQTHTADSSDNFYEVSETTDKVASDEILDQINMRASNSYWGSLR